MRCGEEENDNVENIGYIFGLSKRLYKLANNFSGYGIFGFFVGILYSKTKKMIMFKKKEIELK